MIKTFLVALVAAVLASPLSAHSQLTSSVPAKDEVVVTRPEVIILTFISDMRLATVTLDQSGIETRLDVPRKPAGTQFEIPMAAGLVNGPVTVNWRGIGADGHVQKGAFAFQLDLQ